MQKLLVVRDRFFEWSSTGSMLGSARVDVTGEWVDKVVQLELLLQDVVLDKVPAVDELSESFGLSKSAMESGSGSDWLVSSVAVGISGPVFTSVGWSRDPRRGFALKLKR